MTSLCDRHEYFLPTSPRGISQSNNTFQNVKNTLCQLIGFHCDVLLHVFTVSQASPTYHCTLWPCSPMLWLCYKPWFPCANLMKGVSQFQTRHSQKTKSTKHTVNPRSLHSDAVCHETSLKPYKNILLLWKYALSSQDYKVLNHACLVPLLLILLELHPPQKARLRYVAPGWSDSDNTLLLGVLCHLKVSLSP